MSSANTPDEVKRLRDDLKVGLNIDRAAVVARRAEAPTVEVTETDIKAVLETIYRTGRRTMANRVRSHLISALRWVKIGQT
jgi:hypothetical protein